MIHETTGRRTLRVLRLLVIAGCAASCTGTDTGNPLTASHVSKCKTDAPPAADGGGAEEQALTRPAPDSANYNGLSCLRWQRAGTLVTFEAYNFEDGCGVEWQTSAQLQDGNLTLAVHNPSCTSNRCGSCMYDASFTLDEQHTALDVDAKVAFAITDCHGKATPIGSWTLHEGNDASGITCQYDARVGFAAEKLGLCGHENMPCADANGSCFGASGTQCQAGLQCTSVATDDERCLEPCDDVEDCALPDAMTCDHGSCRLR